MFHHPEFHHFSAELSKLASYDSGWSSPSYKVVVHLLVVITFVINKFGIIELVKQMTRRRRSRAVLSHYVPPSFRRVAFNDPGSAS